MDLDYCKPSHVLLLLHQLQLLEVSLLLGNTSEADPNFQTKGCCANIAFSGLKLGTASDMRSPVNVGQGLQGNCAFTSFTALLRKKVDSLLNLLSYQ